MYERTSLPSLITNFHSILGRSLLSYFSGKFLHVLRLFVVRQLLLGFLQRGIEMVGFRHVLWGIIQVQRHQI